MKYLVFLFFFLSVFSTSAKEAHYTFGIVGDGGHWNSDTQKVRNSMLSHGVKRLILPGDNLYFVQKGYHAVWENWINKGFRFPIVALGNHYLSYESEIEYFNMPGEYFTILYPHARFIVLNSDTPNTIDRQFRYLNREMHKVTSELVFWVYHHPTFTLTKRHGWKEKKEFQLYMRDAIKKWGHKVAAVITGHDHIASLVSLNGFPKIVSGAIFEQLAAPPVKYSEGEWNIKTVWTFKSGPFWTRLDFKYPDKRVWTTFINANTNKVECVARVYPKPIELNSTCLKTRRTDYTGRPMVTGH